MYTMIGKTMSDDMHVVHGRSDLINIHYNYSSVVMTSVVNHMIYRYSPTYMYTCMYSTLYIYSVD